MFRLMTIEIYLKATIVYNGLSLRKLRKLLFQ